MKKSNKTTRSVSPSPAKHIINTQAMFKYMYIYAFLVCALYTLQFEVEPTYTSSSLPAIFGSYLLGSWRSGAYLIAIGGQKRNYVVYFACISTWTRFTFTFASCMQV